MMLSGTIFDSGRTLSAYTTAAIQNHQEQITYTVYNEQASPITGVLLTGDIVVSFLQGLDILHELLSNVGRTPNVAQAFYQQYLLSLIQDVFAVMTDRLHKSGFKMHATMLRQMFHLVQMNQVTVPLFDPSQQPPGTTNPGFLREHISNLLVTSFPNLSRTQVSRFVEGMFDVKMDLPTFKAHLRDFLITLKKFSSEDNSALFTEEREKAAREQEHALMAQRSAVPGILKPSEIDNDL